MKQILASIQPHRLQAVTQALRALPRFPGFTHWHTEGEGHGSGVGGAFTDADRALQDEKRVVVWVVCEDGEADAIAAAIHEAAHTGAPHDGLIVISDIGGVVRIQLPLGGDQR